MSSSGSPTNANEDALKRLQEQSKILQANLELYKLTQQQEQARLQADIDRVKLKAERQKAEADAIKALLPAGSTKPLSGETKTDEKFGYLAKLAVNAAVKSMAQAIAQQVRGAVGRSDPARVILVDTLDFCGDDFLALQISQQMEALKKVMGVQTAEIERLSNSIQPQREMGEEVFILGASLLPAIGPVIAGVPGMISFAADIAAYFQVEDTYKSVDVTVPLTALQASVANALGDTPPKVSACFPNFHTFGTLTELPILAEFSECTAARDELSAKAAQFKILIDSLKKKEEEDSAQEIAAQLKLAEAAYATAQTMIQAFDDFGKLMTTIPEGKSASPLARVAMRAYLKNPGSHTDDPSPTYLLYLNVVSSGGEVSIRKFLWWTRGIVFLGGCVVTYVLADLAGNTLASGTLSKLTQTQYARSQKEALQFLDLIQS